MYIVGLWIVWAVLGIVLLGLIFYHMSLAWDEDDALSLEDQTESQRASQKDSSAKQNRIQHVIRICGGVEGLLTLVIAAFYILDALRQSG